MDPSTSVTRSCHSLHVPVCVCILCDDGADQIIPDILDFIKPVRSILLSMPTAVA